MGYSPGEFRTIKETGAGEYHWEFGNGTIKLWNAHEENLILVLDAAEARKACDQLELLVGILEGSEEP